MDFELSEINYIILFIVAFKMIWDLAVIIINCVARLFNMIFLYIIAPPFIATIPLDEGGKLKQWTTAFTVQCFSVFGSIIAMRVLLLFIPIVIDSKLVLLPNSSLNLLAKMVLILGGMSTAKRASSVITGILADNAGMQAIHAGDMGDSVRQKMDNARNYATGLGQTSWGRNQGHGLFGRGRENDREKKEAKKDREESRAEKKEARREKEKAEREQPAKERQQAKKAQAKEQWRADMLAAVRGGEASGAQRSHSASADNAGGGSSSGTGSDLPKSSGGERGGSGGQRGSSGEQRSGSGGQRGSSGGAGTMTDQQYKDLFGVSRADYEAGKTGGDSIPQAPDISQTSHFDEGRDWLPDGDVLTADSFTSDKSGPASGSSGTDQQFQNVFGISRADYEAGKAGGGSIPQTPDISQTSHFDEGRDWLPDGDVLTADSFAPDKSGPASGSSVTDQQFQNVFGISRDDFEAGGSGARHPRKAPPPPRENSLPSSNRK